MSKITEIATDVYRISIYVPEFNLQFNHFLIKDNEPLLFHTDLKAMFPAGGIHILHMGRRVSPRIHTQGQPRRPQVHLYGLCIKGLAKVIDQLGQNEYFA